MKAALTINTLCINVDGEVTASSTRLQRLQANTQTHLNIAFRPKSRLLHYLHDQSGRFQCGSAVSTRCESKHEILLHK